MFFRRELDFDELIEAIDQLADEEIDEVVDWQMTESPAAKSEGIGMGTLTGQVGADQTITWRSRQPAREPIRTELQLGRRNGLVIPSLPETFNPITDTFNPITDSRWTLQTQHIGYEVQTMWDPMRDILHIRLAWSSDQIRWRYQQVGVSQLILEGARPGIEILRSEDIAPGKRIIVCLDPGARTREYPVRAFLESDQ